LITIITIKSNYAELKIDEAGNICSLGNILTKQAPFCYLKKGTDTIYPVAAELEDDNIKFTFGDGYLIPIKYTAGDFFTFEVDKVSDEYDRFYLIDLNINNCDDMSAVLYAMNVNTITSDYPDAKADHIFAYCAKLDNTNVKAALCAAPKALHREIMKKICDSCDPNAAIVSKAGGAYALDWEENFGDYLIISESEWAKVEELVDAYKKYGINQFDFHKGKETFRHGDFHFYKYKDAKEFKTEVSDKLAAVGIASGLHTYAFYVDYESNEILSNPNWQKDLEIMAYFTLSADIDETDNILPVCESMEGVKNNCTFFSHNSPYVLIDNEIIKINIGDNGFIDCTRGDCGTAKSKHPKGSKVGRIGGCFNMFAPVPDSELFYQIARNIAAAYNDGGFSMIYVDAIDGMGNHTRNVEYYDAKFIHEIIKHCVKPPVIEYSSMHPSLWYARGRAGAFDVGRRGYKTFFDLHIADNKKFMDRYYTTTLGWHHFCWMTDDCPPNYATKYQFSDDVEYLGTKAIAYNCSIALFDIFEPFKDYDGLFRNMELYALFNDLRKQNYFPAEIREKLKTGEYTLKQIDGEYIFFERGYQKFREESGSSRNPFKPQKPFIRIEAMQSTNNEDPISLLQLPESPIDFTKNLALCAKIFGNNSSDVISVRLSSSVDSAYHGVAEYFIPLDFAGWRDVVITELHNGERTDLIFDIPKGGSFYSYYHAMPNFAKIDKIVIAKSGDCEGVIIDNISMRRHTSESVQKLTLKINGRQIDFNCNLNSSDYIEYNDGIAYHYDPKGKQTAIKITDDLEEIDGEFNFSIESDNPNARFKTTFGFTGEQLKYNKSGGEF